ncbi:pre-RNA processing PIH1/Nop17 [Metschnikowia aff. pulcherrima]|uniref:Pre-RNA processing PIH1/Nop17 n=1 Tax=Metschnikowia aff. pulcherrima TaxID=2163413 RepID=A0A4P6XRU0_9ASCO|nr:pre-RNA processing PIH1/Nop17 [Metschnikowia aff. pulcherrima]
MAAIFEQGEGVKLDPKPGFVVKTRIIEGQGEHLYSTKVFINICHESRVPKPPTEFDPAIVFPMIVQNEWEIPIIVSLEKKAVDKKGVPLLVYDCCINSDCFQWVQVSKDLRLILVEWALESVEMMHELVLEREYTFPKMLCKGELSQTEITQEDLKNGFQKKLLELKNNETQGLIEELGGRLGDLDETENIEELPDLTNIDGKRNRPLIEEIGEMTLEEAESRHNSPQLPKMGQKIQELDETVIVSENEEKSEALKYRYIVTRELRDDHMYVLFESAELTQNIEVSFSELTEPDFSTITIQNLDPSRKLDKNNCLEIPVPAPYIPYKSFLLEKKGQLYIFCKAN